MCEGDGEEYELKDFYEHFKAIVVLVNSSREWTSNDLKERLYLDALFKVNHIQQYCDPKWVRYETSDVDIYNDLVILCVPFKDRTKVGTNERKQWNEAIRNFKKFRDFIIKQHHLLKTILPGDIVKGTAQGDLIWASVYEVLSVDCDRLTITINKANGYDGSQVPKEVHCGRLKLVAKKI